MNNLSKDIEDVLVEVASRANGNGIRMHPLRDYLKTDHFKNSKAKANSIILEFVKEARLDELAKVWGGMNTAGQIRDGGKYSSRDLNLDDLSYYLHNRRRVLQGKKALTPEKWFEAER